MNNSLEQLLQEAKETFRESFEDGVSRSSASLELDKLCDFITRAYEAGEKTREQDVLDQAYVRLLHEATKISGGIEDGVWQITNEQINTVFFPNLND